jgi:hypothetical protein
MHQLSTSIALLVDIENIKISAALETAIIKLFPPAEMIKIAVGNWQLLKGVDQELVDRGYHLFHVPTGKNNADHELINLGWMLKDASELIIVSNDKIFIQFAYKLKFGIKATSIVYYSQPQAAFVITKTQVLIPESKQVPISPLESVPQKLSSWYGIVEITDKHKKSQLWQKLGFSNFLFYSIQALAAKSLLFSAS